MSHHRYRADPNDDNKTIDLYRVELEKSRNPMWAIAIELARIADVLGETGENPEQQCILDTLRDIGCAAWETKDSIDAARQEFETQTKELDASLMNIAEAPTF
jgi:hypothetical protein